MLWDVVYPDRRPDLDLSEGRGSRWAATSCRCSTHRVTRPGAAVFHDSRTAVLFSGDTLFCGGPGATGRSFSDRPTILHSIRERLLALPGSTVVHTGHGDSTTIEAERPLIEELVRAELSPTKTAPAPAAISDAAMTASLADSASWGSERARSATKIDTVNPMPATTLRPVTVRIVIPSGS